MSKNTAHLKELSRLALDASKQLNSQINLLGDVLNEKIKEAPKEDKSKVEELKILMTKSINLAKQGKSTEADSLIKNFRNKWV